MEIASAIPNNEKAKISESLSPKGRKITRRMPARFIENVIAELIAVRLYILCSCASIIAAAFSTIFPTASPIAMGAAAFTAASPKDFRRERRDEQVVETELREDIFYPRILTNDSVMISISTWISSLLEQRFNVANVFFLHRSMLFLSSSGMLAFSSSRLSNKFSIACKY